MSEQHRSLCMPCGENFICGALLRRNARAQREARRDACGRDAWEACF
jgi:hypothetical protein